MSEHACLQTLLLKAFDTYSSRTALVQNHVSVSYKDLWDQASALAGFLVHLESENIGICGNKDHGVYVGILASVIAGKTYVPINPKWPEDKILRVLSEARVSTVVSTVDGWHRWGGVFNDRLQYVVIPEQHLIWTVLQKHTQSIHAYTCLNSPLLSTRSDNVYVMFTSGSTGQPKGVEVTHKNVISLLDAMHLEFPVEAGFRASQTYDLSFDPSVADMFFTWSYGGALFPLSEKDMLSVEDFIRNHELTIWSSAPAVPELPLNRGVLTKDLFPSLRHSFFCGEPLTYALASAWEHAAPHSTINNLYGPTETTVWVTRYSFSQKTLREQDCINGLVPIGRPLAHVHMEILSHEGVFHESPCDESPSHTASTGELLIAGPQLAKGYLNDPDLTEKKFVMHPKSSLLFYKTGDLASLDEHRMFHFHGRADWQVKIGGKRVELGEVEYHVRKHSPCVDAVVLPEKDRFGRVVSLVAFSTVSVTRSELKQVYKHITSFLDESFFPKRFIHIESMPLNTNNKVDRKHLACML